MLRRALSRLGLAVSVVGALTQPLGSQAPPSGAAGPSLELTSSSETAKREFRMMLAEIFNLRPAKARSHGLNAVAADPNFGLAKIHLARPTLSPELSATARVEEMSRGLGLMTTASAPEILLGVYAREVAAGRTATALPILRAAADMVPGDQDVAFMLMNAERAGRPIAEIVSRERAFIAKYPDFTGVYNQYAYDLQASGDSAGALAAARRQVELLPDHPNAHDTWADILLLQGRIDEAYLHTEASVKLDSTYVNAYVKQGTIALVHGQYAPARALFKRASDIAGIPAARVEARYWTAASYLYQHDVKAALRELAAASDEATAAKLPAAQLALPHLRMAVIEAMVGDRKTVETHLAKAAELAPANTLNQTLHATLAAGALGDAKAAEDGARAYAAATGASAPLSHTLAAVAAMAAKNLPAAEAHLAQSPPTNLLAKTLRAEVMKAKGQVAEARVVRDEILKAPLKLDGNGPLDFTKLVARLRAERL